MKHSISITAVSLVTAASFCAPAYASSVMGLTVENSAVTEMSIDKSVETAAFGVAAVYDGSGRLKGVSVSEASSETGEGILSFCGDLTVETGETLKGFLWEPDGNGGMGIKPMSDAFIWENSATSEPDITDEPDSTSEPDATDEPDSTTEPDVTDDPLQDGYKAVFETDEHCSVTVSDTQDFVNVTENATEAYARDGATGDILTDGNGQVNFMAVADEGYEIASVSVQPSGSYKNLKTPADTGTGYRITKITGDIAVSVTSKEKLQSTADPNTTAAPGDGIIHLLGNSINADGIAGVTVTGTTAIITAAGEYTVEGTLSDGQISVSLPAADDIAVIGLNGVNVTNTTADAFKADKGKITLAAADGTENIFSAEADGACGVYSKNDLIIKGSGKITANSAAGNGIRSKKDIEIGSGDVEVNAAKNGIKGDKSVKITKKNNSVTVVSGGDGIKSDTAPAEVTDELTGEVMVEGGTVTVNGGNVTITAKSTTDAVTGEISTGDGIQADSLLTIAGGTINITADGEALKANASSVEYLADSTVAQTPAEGNGKVVISGGTLVLSAGEDGIKAVKGVEVSGGSTTIAKALDGVQVNEIIYASDGTTELGRADGEINITGGSLNITCSEDGIQCATGDINVIDGDITVNSKKDCIQSDYYTDISGGSITLTANGGALGANTTESCKGVKAGQLVNITGGTLDIDTYDDAVHSNHTVRISGGKLTASTADDGIHGDSFLYISGDADITVTKSYEGIEAAEIYISGGKTVVVSSDDGANAAGEKPADSAYEPGSGAAETASLSAGPGGWGGGWGGPDWGGDDSSAYGYLEVSGGLLYVEAEGDGFDSNGDGLISGGTVLINGPTSGGNGVFDIGDNGNTLRITGGTVIGAGTSDMAVTPSGSQQYYVVASGRSGGGMGRPGQTSSGSFSTQAAGKAFKLTGSSGNEIVTYVPSKQHSWIFVSSPEMTDGTYTLTYGGSVSGGTVTGFNGYGIVTGGSFSGGSALSLTASR